MTRAEMKSARDNSAMTTWATLSREGVRGRWATLSASAWAKADAWVGAGGIGRVVEAQRQYFRFDRVLGVLVIVFVVVFVIEQVSVAIRKRLV